MAVSFGPFVLHRERRQLLENGAEVHLSPKAYAFLTTLIDHRPRALSKSELHERLWPGTFVVEANLSVVAAEVRKALRDEARHSMFVRTVRGFGYAFAAEAREGVVPPSDEGQPERSAAGPARCRIVHGERETALGRGAHVIGRDDDASVRIDLVTTSRRHALLVVSDSGVTIEDLGSKNGTWLRGARITAPTPLADGDELLIGHSRILFRSVTGALPTKSVEREVEAENRREDRARASSVCLEDTPARLRRGPTGAGTTRRAAARQETRR